MRDALGSLFSAEGHACELAADATSALELVRQQTFDAVLSDVLMEGMDGLELLDRIKETHPRCPSSSSPRSGESIRPSTPSSAAPSGTP